MKRTIIIPSMALCIALCGAGAAFGQGRGGGADDNPGAGQGRGGPPPLPPFVQALDTNHDGVIDATEIANAAQSLRTLEKSGTDQLTIEDLLGPPHAPRGGQAAGPDASGRGGGPPPLPPGIQALDTNHDGVLTSDEITAAATSLKTLLKNGSTQLTIPDLLGPPHGRGQGGQGGAGGPGRGGPPPLPPVVQALDTNHDGILDEKEIANASKSLSTLLKSGSTQLSMEDLMGPPPHARGDNWPMPGEGGQQGRGQANAGGPDTQLANPGQSGTNSAPPSR